MYQLLFYNISVFIVIVLYNFMLNFTIIVEFFLEWWVGGLKSMGNILYHIIG